MQHLHPHTFPCIFTISLLFAFGWAGCWSIDALPDAGPDVGPRDGARDTPEPEPQVTAVSVEDAGGRAWSFDAAPRRPRFVVTFSRPPLDDPREEVLFLFASDDHEAIADDVARRPLLVAHERVRVPCDLRADRHVWTLTPREPLEPGGRYVLALGHWIRTPRGEPFEGFVRDVRVVAEEGGASPRATWPPDGAAGVPPTLPFAAVRFDDEVHHLEGVTLASDEDGPVRVSVRREDCALTGWRDGVCARLTWSGALLPDHTYRLRVSDEVVDRAGGAIGPFVATFTTGRETSSTLRPLPLECAPDESEVQLDDLPFGCALADDDAVQVRAQLGAPVRAALFAGERVDRDVAPRGEVVLELAGLGPERDVHAELHLSALDGRTTTAPLRLRTQPPLATLTITEVRANPRGPEPRQEYVEVLNYGGSPVSLLDVAIADRPDRIGDVIAHPIMLPAGARALLVADAFDPNHPDDPAVPEGVALVRLGSSVASGGLTNAGEALFLRDAEGRRLSHVPAVATEGGECAWREGPRRRGEVAIGPCTPGGPGRASDE